MPSLGGKPGIFIRLREPDHALLKAKQDDLIRTGELEPNQRKSSLGRVIAYLVMYHTTKGGEGVNRQQVLRLMQGASAHLETRRKTRR